MNPPNRVAKWSLIFGIVIVLNLFFNYALSLVYKQPSYSDFCPQMAPISTPTSGVVDQKTMDAQNQQFITCQKNFDTAMGNYNQKVFIILIVLGAISVFIGNFFGANVVIANGLSMAGVLSFIIASMHYWSTANNLIKVFILVVALAILFWVAMKKFNNERLRS